MPLLDHFRRTNDLPVKWASVHAMWAAEITGRLNAHWLGPKFTAGPRTTVAGHSEIDIATYEREIPESRATTGSANGTPLATLESWTAPDPLLSQSVEFSSLTEVQILKADEGIIVAAIEIVSPSNKDRPESREAFVGKCLDYIGQGVCVVIVDVVTTLRASLQAQIARQLGVTSAPFDTVQSGGLYAATFRPTERDGQSTVDVWSEACEVGTPLPTMPMRLTGDTFVPVEFELTYVEACKRLKVAV
jgi:Protein of unknown function (DUF4058)